MIMRVQKQPLLLGLGIILFSNLVALSGVVYNRSGEHDSMISLTQRELTLPYRYQHGLDKDNSGLYLQLEWRTIDSDIVDSTYYWQAPGWLDRAKLADLGFDVSIPPEAPQSQQFYGRMLPREVVLVLEYDGAAYGRIIAEREESLAKAERELRAHPDNASHLKEFEAEKRQLDAELNDNSRLFVVDAGTEPLALRTKYPQRHQYILARGQVHLRHFMTDEKQYYLMGFISRLSIEEMHVPLEYRDVVLGKVSADVPNPAARKFRAEVSYGRRLEPWLITMQAD